MEEFSSEVNRLIQQSQALGWEEGLPEVLPDEEEASRASTLSLVGKILSQKGLNKQASRATIVSSWSFVKELTSEDLEAKLFLFKLTATEDRDRVLSQGPWNPFGGDWSPYCPDMDTDPWVNVGPHDPC